MRILWLGIPLSGAAVVLSLAARPSESTLAAFATPLAGRTASQRHNARQSAEKLNGAIVAPGDVFSFNDRVGTYSRDAGYRKAPVSYSGQLIDDWGGGVCQTSTTLYNAALLGGMNVVERHRHEFQPQYVGPGRDAAVAFSNIDLKFQNPHPFPVRIVASARGDVLRVELRGAGALKQRPQVYSRVLQRTEPATFRIDAGKRRRLRNSGKPGWEVVVYRRVGDVTELVSKDIYPVMHRVVEGAP